MPLMNRYAPPAQAKSADGFVGVDENAGGFPACDHMSIMLESNRGESGRSCAARACNRAR